jgi:hypothetical protein
MIPQTGKQILATLTLLWLMVFSASVHAELRVTVDRTEITDADQIKLTIRLDNATTSSNPDFRALERDFEIVQRSGPNQSSRISIVNGRQTSEVFVTWELRLRPKRLGVLTIPAFRFGSDTSSPIQIRVSQQSAEMKRKMSQLVFFETSVDTNETYVQGQILYTIKLYYVENISGDFPAPPAVQDVLVEIIESEKRYDAITNGRRYYVLEKKYGLYPQKSGAFTIPAQTFSGFRVGPGFFSTREPVLSRSESHTVEVKPKPASFPGDHWLPATELNLDANWLSGAPNFVVGEPVNRSIEIQAKGVASSLLPELNVPEVPGVKTYQDPPVEEQNVNAEGISAKQTVVVGIVPTKSGTIELPEIKIPWWNTRTDQLELAVIPAETFTVAPSPQSSVVVPQRGATGATVPAAQGDNPVSSADPFWRNIALGLLAAWIATLFIWLFTWLSSRRTPETKNIPTEPSLDEKAALKDLTQACTANDGQAVQSHLVTWGRFRYPGIRSIQELAQRSGDEALRSAIRELESKLYAPNANGKWLGNNLLKAINNVGADQSGSRATNPLPALNPTAG